MMIDAKRGKISPRQLFCIFFVSRIVVSLTYVQSVSVGKFDTDVPISFALSMPLTFLMSVPAVLCVKKKKSPQFSSEIPARMRNTPHRRICLRLAPLTTKDFSRHRYNTASCAPARRDVDRVFCPLARSSRRVASPGQYALMLWLFSCRCDSSFRDGRRPGRFVLRSPGSAFPIRNRGFLRARG